VLESKGFEVFLAATNDIDPRIKALEMYLTENRPYDDADWTRSWAEIKQAGPNPGIIIDPSCTVLIEALQSKYRYKRNKIGELDPRPEKKHPVSDVIDAAGYLAMGVNTGQFKRRTSNLHVAARGGYTIPNRRAWT
jgi:hypothetical protein